MRKKLIIVAVVVLIVVITGGILAYSYLPTQNPTPNLIGETNTPPKALLTVDEIRDGAMVYLAANHTGIVSTMNDLSWSGGKQDTGLLGAETYVYTSGSWSCVIDYPVVSNPVYSLAVDYSKDGVVVSWMGSYQNGAFSETSATVTGVDSTLTEEGIRDLTMMFLKVYHNNTSTYMHGMSWTGGQMDMGMMVGSNKYNYQSNGWNVTIQNPVVPNPPYTITAIYMPSNMQTAMMTWEGTLDNGIMTQNSYAYNP
ncbi:MAG: hypothetical protein M1540_10085 [Candidatus Bathyarchaeota archaeon]|nr:hypothetical protein [Candidatus Bathyarchaeota archaeon]